MRILVIDDDLLVRQALARLLRSKGYAVDTAADGRRGLEEFRRASPDIIITDIIMPEQEGIETIRQIRLERPQVKILAISGGGQLGNLDVLSIAGKLGADDVLAKPFDAAELLKRVRRLHQPLKADEATA